MNQERRDQLRDAAVRQLAQSGGRGLTHRAVDGMAGVPLGTTKNYFRTRDDLLRAVAERCVEQYHQVATPAPASRDSLAAMLASLLKDAAGPGRHRMLAVVELQAEAARTPWLAAILDDITTADFDRFEQAQRAAGLPVTKGRAAVVTLALHAAVSYLLADGAETRAAAGLQDPETFVRELLDAVYGPGGEEP